MHNRDSEMGSSCSKGKKNRAGEGVKERREKEKGI